MKPLTSIIMHHTDPHQPHLLAPKAQHIIHKALTIEMPPPTRKPRAGLHPLHHRPRAPPLHTEAHHRHPHLLIPTPITIYRDIGPPAQVVEQDALQDFLVRCNLRPGGRAVGAEIGDDGGEGGDELVGGGGEAEFRGEGGGGGVEVVG